MANSMTFLIFLNKRFYLYFQTKPNAIIKIRGGIYEKNTHC